MLRNALDTIGAFSLKNPAWKAQAEQLKLPTPSPPSWVVPTKKGRDG